MMSNLLLFSDNYLYLKKEVDFFLLTYSIFRNFAT